jgi:hypothetical protein
VIPAPTTNVWRVPVYDNVVVPCTTVYGVTAFDGADATLLPTLLVAVTLKV